MNQVQDQYQELKNRIIALEKRVQFLDTQLLKSEYLEKRLDDKSNTRDNHALL